MNVSPTVYGLNAGLTWANLVRGAGILALTLTLAPSEGAAEDQALRRARAEMYQNLTQRQAVLNADLERLDERAVAIEQWLAARGIAPVDLAARVEAAIENRTRLVAVVAAAERKVEEDLREMQVDSEMGETAFESGKLELARLREEIERLRRELREKPRDVGLQTSVSLAGLSSRPFLLTGDRIAPFGEPYFSSELIRVRRADRTLEMRRRFERESDAGTIRASILPGGVVDKMVNAPDFDPAQTYLTLWVCADAIEGYRLVSEFLKSRGVRYTWTTDTDEPWLARPESPGLDAWGYGAN